MAYTVHQNQEIPFNLIIKNADDAGVLSIPLPTHNTDMTPESAREHPDNGAAFEFAQRVALALTFVETTPLMTLAMGVSKGGVKTMAMSILRLEDASLSLKGMIVSLGQCAADEQMTESARLATISQLVEATNYAKDERVQAIMADSDDHITAELAAGNMAATEQPAAAKDGSDGAAG